MKIILFTKTNKKIVIFFIYGNEQKKMCFTKKYFKYLKKKNLLQIFQIRMQILMCKKTEHH